MSEIEHFESLFSAAAREANSLPGPAPVKVCGQRSLNAASSGDHAPTSPACRQKTSSIARRSPTLSVMTAISAAALRRRLLKWLR